MDRISLVKTSASGHLLNIYQVKRLLDLDFIPQTQSRSDHKTSKELPGKSSVGLRTPPPGYYFGNDEVTDLNGRILLNLVEDLVFPSRFILPLTIVNCTLFLRLHGHLACEV